MTRLIASILILTLLAACGGQRSGSSSSLNPFNWFGRSKEARIVLDTAVIVDPRGMVAEVISLKVDRMPGGAIISAIGVPETQGYWEATLTPLNREKPDKGKLSYEFRLLPPPAPNPVGTARSREVIVGHFVSDQTLEGVRSIEVIALKNRRSVRR